MRVRLQSPVFAIARSLYLSVSPLCDFLCVCPFLSWDPGRARSCRSSLNPPPLCCDVVLSIIRVLLSKSLGSWSASTSPARSPSPSRFGVHSSAQHRSKKERPKNHPAHQPYDTTILCERSRSPSPASLLQELRDRDHTRRKYRNGMGTGHLTFCTLLTYFFKCLCLPL